MQLERLPAYFYSISENLLILLIPRANLRWIISFRNQLLSDFMTHINSKLRSDTTINFLKRKVGETRVIFMKKTIFDQLFDLVTWKVLFLPEFWDLLPSNFNICALQQLQCVCPIVQKNFLKETFAFSTDHGNSCADYCHCRYYYSYFLRKENFVWSGVWLASGLNNDFQSPTAHYKERVFLNYSSSQR